MSNDDDDNKNKEPPKLKILNFEKLRNSKKIELTDEVEIWQSEVIEAYELCRSLFSKVNCLESELRAVNHLRTAFLQILNPLRIIDQEYDIPLFDIDPEE